MRDADCASVAETNSVSERSRRGLRIPAYALAFLFALLDIAVAWASVIAAHALYRYAYAGGPTLAEFTGLGPLVAGVFALSQLSTGAYLPSIYIDRRKSQRLAVLGWCCVFFIIGWVAFLLKATDEFSRVGLTASFFLGLAAVAGARGVAASVVSRALGGKRFVLRRAFLITSPAALPTRELTEHLQSEGSEIVAVRLLPGPNDTTPYDADLRDELQRAFIEHGFDDVYIRARWENKAALRTLLESVNRLPVRVLLLTDPDLVDLLQGERRGAGVHATFEVQKAPLSLPEQIMKRTIDITVATTALFLLLPLIATAATAVKLESRGPVIFKQRRKGFGGRLFTIYKLRTMRVLEDGDVVRQATRNDARVTRVGAVLRRTSIDELPQLWNVIRGDMSVVGPRPHAVAHDSYYDNLIASYAERRRVKPGLTGWAQVSGLRGETKSLEAMANRVSHDLWYINNWSIWLDMKIILRTIVSRVSHDNAY